MIDYRRDPDAQVEECFECNARLNDDGGCDYCAETEEAQSFVCAWCKETLDDDDIAPNVYEQMGFDAEICVWCAEDSGHYVIGLSYD